MQTNKKKKPKTLSISGNRILLINWNRIITQGTVCIIYTVVLQRQNPDHICVEGISKTEIEFL